MHIEWSPDIVDTVDQKCIKATVASLYLIFAFEKKFESGNLFLEVAEMAWVHNATSGTEDLKCQVVAVLVLILCVCLQVCSICSYIASYMK